MMIIAGVGLGLHGGDAGLAEGPAAGGADGLGGIALMLVLRQEAVADLGMAIFGQALEAEVAHPVAGVILIEAPCGVPDPLVGVGQ